MTSNWLKYAAIGAVLLAVVLGVLAYRMTLQVTEAAKEQVRREQPAAGELASATLAIVALKPLRAARVIAPEDVAIKPVAVVPKNYYTQLEDVVGRAPLLDIDAGAPVTQRYFRDQNILARIIPEGFKAVSVEVTDVEAVGGFVRPGDEVDVMLFLRGSGKQPAQARILLRRALVLAYEERIIERPEGLKDDEGGAAKARRGRTRTTVLAVPEDEITRTMLAASVGDLRLALHRQSLEPAVAQPSEGVEPAQDKNPDRVITLAELSALKRKAPAAVAATEPTRAPKYTVEVFRGGTSEKVAEQ